MEAGNRVPAYLLVYLTSAVHLDLDGQLTGVNLDECRLGLVEKADEIEPRLG